MAEERVQRRLAAILAADVVGYSRLMGADETGTLARLKTLRKELFDPKTAQYGGRLVKTTGDGVLVEFPSAVDAVQHAVDVQQALTRQNIDLPENRRIELRIGVNLGDVIVDGDDIYGDGVNVAARLEALAEPGRVYISDLVHASIRNKLALDFDDLGEQSLKNIADPVRVYRVALGATSDSAIATATDALFRRPAVAVLPFDNLSGNTEQEYFADGLTEDIITALSLWRSFPVIARNSTFAYKGTSPDVRKVGEELGVRYVVEGSVRKGGDRVRVTAQLINAETGHHVWAERYDRDLKDIFAVQDEISARVAGTVAPELERAERARFYSRNPSNFGAWELYQQGYSLVSESTRDSVAAGREMLLRALELEPSYARARACLALSHHIDLYREFAFSRSESLYQLVENARKAVELDVSDSMAHLVSSIAALWLGDHETAVAEGREAVHLNPVGSTENVIIAAALDFSGHPEEAVEYFLRSLRINPRPNSPRIEIFMTMLARAQLGAGQFEAALESASRATRGMPEFVEAHLIRASTLAHLGQQSEASAAFLKAREYQATDFVLPANWARYKDPSASRKILDGLRKAGWEG